MFGSKKIVMTGLILSFVCFVYAQQESPVVAVKKKKKCPTVSSQQLCEAIVDIVQRVSEVFIFSGHIQSLCMNCVRTIFEGDTASFDKLTKEQKNELLACQTAYQEAIDAFEEATKTYHQKMKVLTK